MYSQFNVSSKRGCIFLSNDAHCESPVMEPTLQLFQSILVIAQVTRQTLPPIHICNPEFIPISRGTHAKRKDSRTALAWRSCHFFLIVVTLPLYHFITYTLTKWSLKTVTPFRCVPHFWHICTLPPSRYGIKISISPPLQQFFPNQPSVMLLLINLCFDSFLHPPEIRRYSEGCSHASCAALSRTLQVFKSICFTRFPRT